MRDMTLCYILKDNKVLLGLKKRGFAEGKWNGFGGKVETNESIEEATIREVKEECQIDIKKLKAMAIINFFFEKKAEWNQKVHVFVVKEYEGIPAETEEMKPEWFDIHDLPKNMWEDDPYWLPQVLEGKKMKGFFKFIDNNKIIEYKVEEVNTL